VTVLEGLPLIVELMKRARDRILIMPGGRITARNFERIVDAARPREIHLAPPEPPESAMRFRRAHVFIGGELSPPEFDRLESSAAMIGEIVAKAALSARENGRDANCELEPRSIFYTGDYVLL
jgi:copper homeostasis protein